VEMRIHRLIVTHKFVQDFQVVEEIHVKVRKDLILEKEIKFFFPNR
jgi:hypothetical protein